MALADEVQLFESLFHSRVTYLHFNRSPNTSLSVISLSTISLLFALGQPQAVVSPKLTVVAGADDSVETIQSLKEQSSWVLSVVRKASSTPEDLSALLKANALIEKAKIAATQLQAAETIQLIESLGARLAPYTYLQSAVALLAEGLRIKGRAHLYLDEPALAKEAFVSASFLEPAFSPDELVWPPKARLSYADSVASSRNVSSGSLTVQLKPAFCDLWVDGQLQGRGSSTLPNIQPGEHFLGAACVGHQPLGVRVITQPGGKLSQGFLYLKKVPDQTSSDWVSQAMHSPRGSWVYSELIHLLQTDFLLATSKRRPSEWVLVNAKGEILGEPFPKSRPPEELIDFIHLHLHTDWSSVPPPQVLPWYQQWQAWALTGVVVAIGIGVGTYHIAQNNREDRVRLVVGR